MRFYDISLDEDLEIMSKYKINANEFMLVKLLLLSQDHPDNDKYLDLYLKECHSDGTLSREFINLLVDRRIIVKTSPVVKKMSGIFPEDFHFSEVFMKNFFKFSDQMGKEIWDLYPDYIIGSCKNFPAKNFSKRFKDLKELFLYYAKQIKNNPKKHEQVVESLKFAIKHELITSSIIDYLLSNQWDYHIKVMNGEDKMVKLTFDTTQLV